MKKSKNLMTFWSDGEPVVVMAKGRLSVKDFNASLRKE